MILISYFLLRNKNPVRKPSHKIEDNYYTNRNIIGENNNSKKARIRI